MRDKNPNFINPAKLNIQINRLIFLVSLIGFVLIVVSSTVYTQKSLIINIYSNTLHWITILIIIPVLGGVFVKYFKPKNRFLILLISTLISTSILYFQYKRLWVEEPTIFAALIYFISTLSVSNVVSVYSFKIIQLIKGNISDFSEIISKFYHSKELEKIGAIAGIIGLIVSIFAVVMKST